MVEIVGVVDWEEEGVYSAEWLDVFFVDCGYAGR